MEDKLSVLDIKARDASGRQFYIEMQVLAFPAFRRRVLYYWARLHQSQLAEGADYGALQPTVTICFVRGVLLPEVPGWHATFELRERQSGIPFSDQLAVHILQLPRFASRADEVATPLQRWMYFLCHGEELDPDRLPAELHVPAIERALGELQMMNQSELERDRYEARLKWQRDYATGLAEARQEGRQEGLVRQIQAFQRLLRQPVAASEALKQRPLAELEDLARSLEQELAAALPPTPAP